MSGAPDEGHPSHLDPSELGTKEYWETFYSRTLTNISTKHNPAAEKGPVGDAEAGNEDSDSEEEEDDYNADSDPGTSWFSEHNAPQKVLDFLTRETFPLAPVNTLPGGSASEAMSGSSSGIRSIRKRTKGLSDAEKRGQPTILDLGTGNGSMLALLRKRGGFVGEMVGVDYSAKSVELARELQVTRRHEAYLSDSDEEDEGSWSDDEAEKGEDREEEEEWNEIRFEECDILNCEADLQGQKVHWFPYDKGGFDIVLDKGTFDAVSLMTEKSECEKYPGIAGGLVRKGGFLVVTSCNWTEEELVKWFTSAELKVGGDGKLVVSGRVQYPRFRFGGQEGQGVCTVCFQRA
ncbi:putative S-adenosylmethionine-dependent methyltransferase [Aspergillus mulundensis]|uniref:Protein-lysine N-methyltransferase EFM4 n=1 Tax=Aspergillus mulundensis TaxID=1810919 RepID=A0A3D8Q6U3_9EURO|nr:Protein-lysine N-methyltransferase EFM4 [Aspergillus mulundensis]RDW57533.1 Protein-lysine N-methyltransferase EFM4 [Aspergillus mulundensis]